MEPIAFPPKVRGGFCFLDLRISEIIIRTMLGIPTSRSFFFAPGAMLPEGWQVILSRVWYYLHNEYTFGKIKGSVLTLVTGALIFALALLLSRTLSKLLQHRIAK